jgi:hypothetical protein
MFSEIHNKYKNYNAVVILGGSSVLKHIKRLRLLNSTKTKVFVESKALTPRLIKSQIKIDYILSPFPEKLQDNTFQNYILRSFCSKFDIKNYIKKSYQKEYKKICDNFDKYYEIWNPKKGPHKYYKIKNNVYLKNSPMDLLSKINNLKIITNKLKMREIYNNKVNKIKIYDIKIGDKIKKFNLSNFMNPKVKNNVLHLNNYGKINSTSIALIPIVNAMGFKKIYFLGLDMNMMGSMEYSSKNIFKSFLHFLIFILTCKKSFNANYKPNFPLIFLRPKSEFKDLSFLFNKIKKKIYNVNDTSFFIGKINGILKISYNSFFNKIKYD